MSYTIHDSSFWDDGSLRAELFRIFDKCHGCRLCYQLCPSFTYLFDTIDAKGDHVENLESPDYEQSEKLCFQCKLCFPKCPYTPPHEWEIDFPRLMLRAKLLRMKRDGIPVFERLMGYTDMIGKIGGMTAPVANFMNKFIVNRLVMEWLAGIHRKRNLPLFHSNSLLRWINKNRPEYRTMKESEGEKAALFYTCYLNYNAPHIGRAVVLTLEVSGVNLYVPEQVCCGMPHLDSGNLKSALDSINRNIESLEAVVAAGYAIVTPQPTCTYMLKQEYPWLVESDSARKIATGTKDYTEFLWDLHEKGRFNTAFKNSRGEITYHVPCHLKAQNIGFKSRDIMKLIPGAKIKIVDKCSGHDGTWSLKKDYFELSLKIGAKLFQGIEKTGEAVAVTDCSLSGLQIKVGMNRESKHPAEILADAYGLSYS